MQLWTSVKLCKLGLIGIVSLAAADWSVSKDWEQGQDF